ncbi:amidohydrolase family protein [Steroidobacter cummioxidans]|uniref:amidohydrolase family protein n=1 Tax=Steroidobacter cummioxidans TaxID=1803913 RepID=UPI000E31C021|nr:amidohydrolase family protein [Steroidobacter cummioxidans]
MLNRRLFLGGAFATAATVSAGLHTRPLLAENASTAPRALVDWHSHYVSQAEMKFLATRAQPPKLVTGADGTIQLDNATTVSAIGGPSAFAPSDIQARLRNLDQNGIQRQLLTHTVALGFDASLPIEEQRALYRAFNDELAEVVVKNRPRFLAVAALPASDPVWAAQELERAHRELGFIGGSLPLNAFATLAGARTLKPLFDTAQKHNSHFFIHRGPASDRVPGQPPLVVPDDTAYARWNLISNSHLAAGAITLGLTDFLDAYPDVSVEIIMLGGFFTHLFDSIIPAARANGVADPLQKLRRIYIDTGPYSVRNAGWVRYACDKIGADRILFGTDYGVGGGQRGDVGPALATLDATLTPEQRQTIYFDNTRALLAAKGLS